MERVLPPTDPTPTTEKIIDKRVGISLSNYESRSKKELSVTIREELQVINTDEKNWILCRNSLGKMGYVPTSILKIVSKDALVTKRALPQTPPLKPKDKGQIKSDVNSVGSSPESSKDPLVSSFDTTPLLSTLFVEDNKKSTSGEELVKTIEPNIKDTLENPIPSVEKTISSENKADGSSPLSSVLPPLPNLKRISFQSSPSIPSRITEEVVQSGKNENFPSVVDITENVKEIKNITHEIQSGMTVVIQNTTNQEKIPKEEISGPILEMKSEKLDEKDNRVKDDIVLRDSETSDSVTHSVQGNGRSPQFNSANADEILTQLTEIKKITGEIQGGMSRVIENTKVDTRTSKNWQSQTKGETSPDSRDEKDLSKDESIVLPSVPVLKHKRESNKIQPIKDDSQVSMDELGSKTVGLGDDDHVSLNYKDSTPLVTEKTQVSPEATFMKSNSVPGQMNDNPTLQIPLTQTPQVPLQNPNFNAQSQFQQSPPRTMSWNNQQTQHNGVNQNTFYQQPMNTPLKTQSGPGNYSSQLISNALGLNQPKSPPYQPSPLSFAPKGMPPPPLLQNPLQKKLSSLKAKKIENLDRKYKGYKVNFNSVFLVKVMTDGFLTHLKEKESNPEPFEFLLEIHGLPNVVSKDSVSNFFRICEIYIDEKSKKSINISGKDRKPILEVFECQEKLEFWNHNQTPRWVLEQARKVAYNDLKFDAFPRWTLSNEGYDIISFLSDNELVISQNPLYSVLYKLEDAFQGEIEDEEELKTRAGDLSDKTKLKASYFDRDFIVQPKDVHRDFDTNLTRILDVQLQYNMKLKLYVVENRKKSNFEEKVNDVFKSFYNKLVSKEKPVEYEDYSYGLMIGPWFLQFYDNHLCVPQRTLPENIIFCCDLKEILYLKEIDDNLDKLAGTIVNWNANFEFKPVPDDLDRFGNSKNFVDALLACIGLRLALPPHAMGFLSSLKKNKGETKFEFNYVYDFQMQYGLKPGGMVFKTHSDLDEFVCYLLRINPYFSSNCLSEWHFLKGICRGFWLRYLALKGHVETMTKTDPNSPELKGIREKLDRFAPKKLKEGVYSCPCNNPLKTKSFCSL